MPESAAHGARASTRKATTDSAMHTPRNRANCNDYDDRQIARRYDSRGRLKTNEFSNGYDMGHR